MSNEWYIQNINMSDETLGEGGDAPVFPGDTIARVVCETEVECRLWLTSWLNFHKNDSYSSRIELWHNDELIETYFVGR